MELKGFSNSYIKLHTLFFKYTFVNELNWAEVNQNIQKSDKHEDILMIIANDINNNLGTK